MIEIRETVLVAQCLNDSHDFHLPALVTDRPARVKALARHDGKDF